MRIVLNRNWSSDPTYGNQHADLVFARNSQFIILCILLSRGSLSGDKDMNLVFRYEVTARPRDPDHFSQIWRSCTQSPPDLILLSKVLFIALWMALHYMWHFRMVRQSELIVDSYFHWVPIWTQLWTSLTAVELARSVCSGVIWNNSVLPIRFRILDLFEICINLETQLKNHKRSRNDVQVQKFWTTKKEKGYKGSRQSSDLSESVVKSKIKV